MLTKPIDRLLFAQGGLCFFCQRTLPAPDASVEHLVATSNGGHNAPDNCVACCKALNQLLGHMSLKEKLRVILDQKGEFECPNGVAAKRRTEQIAAQRLELVVKDLRKRGKARPRTVQALSNTISTLFNKKLTPHELSSLLNALKAQKIVSVNGTKVTYALSP